MTELPRFPFPAGQGSEPPAEYERLRRHPGLGRVRLPNGVEALLVTRYRDVKQVLSDSRFSRSAYPAGTLSSRSAESLPLVIADDPEHRRRRAAVAHAFTARGVQRIRPMVKWLAKKQAAALASGSNPADLVSGYTVPFTLGVICRILGIPDTDIHRFPAWVEPMMSIGGFPAATIDRCHRELHEYFAALVETTLAMIGRGGAPAGLVAELVASRHRDRRLSRTETVALAAGLLIAGYETTSNELAVAAYHLLRRPQLLATLRGRPGGVATVVEELLRFPCLNGTGGVPHVATVDVSLSDGVVLPAGSVVVPIPDAANRDPAVFSEPNRVRPDRNEGAHVSFGHGAHYCLGAELARLELRVGITTLLTAFPRLRVAVADNDLRWRTDMFVRGLRELPVTWESGKDLDGNG